MTDGNMIEPNEHFIQSIVIYKINPNEQELNKEVDFRKNVDGRIFSHCLLTIENDTAVIKDKDTNYVIGVFSLHHFYFIEQATNVYGSTFKTKNAPRKR